ncbi:hypothetical protein SDRG_14478 [Saprolegnia diclina VS20]|uniref:Uncharacterized protein n=1 Tax=Saprolegnia diclina (strain VS20) TaxID=1156394 RepID=T0RDN8_SAPDV|nr:hypothetical protein SDRG_14478 [Saprolegnia diclina VS20]EQC27727.1 hypothetical protein SDRG_14478 [Saprolegnia diclina VS20]|eukprot:XP_008618832.1 hypothetical protein SDRG_14478 [Saprolegnia diclina VS20]
MIATQPQRARATDIGILLPEITQAIARLLPGPDAFAAFVAALPAWAKTPALAAIARLSTVPSMAVAWPTITVLGPELDSATTEDLVAATALGPYIVIGYTIATRNDLAVVTAVASNITSLTFDLNDASDKTLRFFRSTIASCTYLVSLELTNYGGGSVRYLKGVFFKLAHLTSLALVGGLDWSELELSTGFGERLVHWLRTKPVVSLTMFAISFADVPGSPLCLALCDAISSSATLTTLALNNVNLLERGFLYERPLPVRLASLEWDKYEGRSSDTSEMWDNFLSALAGGPQLTHFSCKHFVMLLHDKKIRHMLRGLSSLEINNCASHYEILDALKTMANLTTLSFRDVRFEVQLMRHLVPVLRKLPCLEVLKFTGKSRWEELAMSTNDLAHLLRHVPRFACLSHLDVSHDALDMATILGLLPTLNAAAKRLRTINLQGHWQPGDVEDFVEAVRRLPDRHFAIVLDAAAQHSEAATDARHEHWIEESGLAPRRGLDQCIVFI